jgi:hypothetical protein
MTPPREPLAAGQTTGALESADPGQPQPRKGGQAQKAGRSPGKPVKVAAIKPSKRALRLKVQAADRKQRVRQSGRRRGGS